MTRNPRIGPMLRLVLGTGALLQPLARPLLLRRLARGKEDPVRWYEKLGQTAAVRPEGALVWMHGVGVGEVMALRGLIAALSAERPDLSFLVTSSARSSAVVFTKNLPARTQHQYLPVDFPAPVRAFLDHWHPDLAVWSDQDIWPRLAVTVKRRSIPQALVAARITDVSARAKARFRAAYGDIYRLLDLRHAQDAGTAAHLSNILGDDTTVNVTGSLKASSPPLADDVNLRTALPRTRPIWLAASAHRADIDIALGAQTLIGQSEGNNHLLIIAPRDLADSQYITQRCAVLKLDCVTQSAGGWPTAVTQVFIADSFGTMGAWYRAARACLIGGTFDATQGHNPWEAAALNCPILHGPKTANFSLDFRTLQLASASRLVTCPGDLALALTDSNVPAMAARALAARENAARGLQRITDDLLGLLRV